MNRRSEQIGRRLAAMRRYGWRDIAAVLGVYAIVLQLGLGVVAGLAGEAIAKQQQASGSDFSTVALQICSPAGLIQLADEKADGPSRGAPVCPGCLFAHAGPIPPQSIAAWPQPVLPILVPLVLEEDAPAPLERITALNPRAPPRLSA